MSDPATTATAAAVVNTPLKSGLLTTELWLKVAVLGALAGLIADLPNLASQLSAIQGLPPYATAIIAAVPMVAAYLAPKMAIAYAQSRTQLKLAQTPPASPDAAAKVLS